MNQTLAQTIQYVTGKPSIDACSQQDLKNIISEYPYFAPAYLTYAAKLKKDGSFQLQTQMQKTGLFVTNSKWLQYQLLDVSKVIAASNLPNVINDIPAPNIVNNLVESTPKVFSVTDIENSNSSLNNTIPNVLNFELNKVSKEEAAVMHEEVRGSDTFISNLNIPSVSDVKNIFASIDAPKDIESTLAEPITQNTIQIEEPNSSTSKTLIADVKPVVFDYDYNKNDKVEHSSTAVIDAKNYPLNYINESETTKENKDDIHAQIAALKQDWIKNHNQEYVDNLPPVDTSVETSIPEPQPIASQLNSIASDWNKPVEAFANQSLSFETEPYYTIDYFASQGIKFDYSKEPQDKLTTKMLKFTDWLKKMKNNRYQPEIKEDPALEAVIHKIAESSNQSKEIVTETMADVFAKQGKNEQAIQLYIKLSFLLPEKTTYFAAKIKELKGI